MRKTLMMLLAAILTAGSLSMTALAYDGSAEDKEVTNGVSGGSPTELENSETSIEVTETVEQKETDAKTDGKETDGKETAETGITPEGNMTLVDDIGAEDLSGQQFITLVTKAGNTFYLIIDRDKDGNQNVHFLNMVDEADLLALMEEDEASKYQDEKDAAATAEPEVTDETQNTEKDVTAEQEATQEPQKKKNTLPFVMLLLFLIGAGGVGGYLFLKMKDGKNAAKAERPDPDADYTDEEEIELPEESEEMADEDENSGNSDGEFDEMTDEIV